MPRGGKRAGAGRPIGTSKEKHKDYVTISISGVREEIEKLKELAKKEGKTVSRYILDLIQNQ